MRTTNPACTCTCMWSFRTIGSKLWCVEQDQDCGQSHRQTDRQTHRQREHYGLSARLNMRRQCSVTGIVISPWNILCTANLFSESAMIGHLIMVWQKHMDAILLPLIPGKDKFLFLRAIHVFLFISAISWKLGFSKGGSSFVRQSISSLKISVDKQ